MTAIVIAIIGKMPSVSVPEMLLQLALFCGAGLLVSLLLMTQGVDLSHGFF